MKFINPGLKLKIMSGSFLPMIICLFLGATGVWTLRMLAETLLSMGRTEQLGRKTLEIERNAAEVQRSVSDYLLTGEEHALEQYKTAATTLSKELTNMKGALGDNHEATKALDDAARGIDSWQGEFVQPLIERRKGISDSQSIREVNDLVSRLRAERGLANLQNSMTTLRKKADSQIADGLGYGARVAKIMEALVIYGLSISTLLTLAISYFLASGITRRLMSAVTFSEAISKGDLSRSLDVSSGDEVGRLGASLNTMVQNLRDQTRKIFDGVSSLSAAAMEISTTVAQVARSAAQTCASVAETTTTVEQVRQAAQLASEKGKNVSWASQQAVAISSSGKKATEDTIGRIHVIKDQMESIGETVVRLSEHSQAIGEMVALVQDLADQSNLLAVNASIEAARAGDHGKGFAVVAHEIKSLADQSKQATEQIRSILGDTKKWVSTVVMATEQGIKAVQAGVDQSKVAGESIETLMGSVLASSQAATVIESTGEQQAIGVGQVATAMTSIDKAMQHVAEGTTQLYESANRLSELSSDLKGMVEGYKV